MTSSFQEFYEGLQEKMDATVRDLEQARRESSGGREMRSAEFAFDALMPPDGKPVHGIANIEFTLTGGEDMTAEKAQEFGKRILANDWIRLRWLGSNRTLAPEPTSENLDHGFVDDGMGSEWPRCKTDCKLEVVRTGKVQCECSEPDLEEFQDALEPGEQP